jgi:hypothetical protein
MTTDQKPKTATPTPVACPKCGRAPETVKVRSYWQTRCQHGLTTPSKFIVTSGHTMLTKRDAIIAWNTEFGPKPAPAEPAAE